MRTVKLLELEPDSLVQTCSACPSQWEATSVDGDEVYVRYRWGGLRIDLNGATIFHQGLGDGLDGVISWEEVVKAAEKEDLFISGY